MGIRPRWGWILMALSLLNAGVFLLSGLFRQDPGWSRTGDYCIAAASVLIAAVIFGIRMFLPSTKRQAQKIAQSRWYVHVVSYSKDGLLYHTDAGGTSTEEGRKTADWLWIELASEGTGGLRQILRLEFFGASHPSLPRLQSLSSLNLIEFKFVGMPLRDVPHPQLCDYLVLKD